MLSISNPHELLSMPYELLSEWLAYIQIKEGTFKTTEQRKAEEKAKKDKEYNDIYSALGITGDSGSTTYKKVN